MPIGQTAYGRAKQRHNNAASYDSANPVAAAGEIIAAIDGPGDMIVKMGDGTSDWDDAVILYPQGGGGAAFYAEQRTIFHANNLPRNPATGAIDGGSIVWNTITYQEGLPETSTTVKPDWGGYVNGSGFLLTDPVIGEGYYELTCNFSFGLPAADAFAGVAMRFGADSIDPYFHYFPAIPVATGFKGVVGSWSTGCVYIGADDGCQMQFVVYGDPLTGAGTGFASSGPSSAGFEVIARRLSPPAP